MTRTSEIGMTKAIIILILIEIMLIMKITALPPVIQVGAVFTEDKMGSPSELAFKYAVHSLNRDKEILPDTTLVYNIQYVPKDDSFHATKQVCNQVKMGVQAIFGPSDPVLGKHIHSICDALDIPHLESRIDLDTRIREFSINIHPSQYYVNEAFRDVIRYLNWTKVGVLFERHYGFIQLHDLVGSSGLEVHVRQVEAGSYLQILNEMKSLEIYNLIVDTRADNISLLLKGILQLQMNEYKYHYLFTSFDIETFDLEDFKYNFVNITAFRLVDLGDVGVKEILKDMETYHRLSKEKHDMFRRVRVIETEPALIYDSVYIFAIGLQTLEQSHTLRLSNISCADENPWDGGLSLINYINAVEWKGLTGPIQFKEGRRIQFKLDLVKLKQHSIVKVGEWSPQTRLNITDPSIFFDSGTMNVTLVVITILEAPYVMMHYGKNFTGNERFFGFCVDILDRVARDVGFDYILDLVPDRKYGAKDPITGEWNGMVAQLMKHKADLAVGSMTINYARESVIDFTKPFMNLGISILFKVPTTPATRLFSFMNPLAVDIWLYVLAAYVLVSITIYTVARFSPYEWHNPHPCNTDNEFVENQFTIANSFWFTIGTLMQQGSDLNPKAASTRIVSAIWWFFTLIIISSYTANLAAFLTVERMITPIENADDLAGQTEITYGTLESGSTMTFFRDSMIETYKKMWRFMDNKKPSVFTSTYEEGIKRVLEGNYAFLMESTMLDYNVQRDCNLTQIGGLLDTKGYGIATPIGSPWRDKISLSILELQEKGEIQILYDKWWKIASDTCSRNDKGKHSKANALGLDNIGGVFVVLLCGLTIAVFVAIIEFYHHNQKKAAEDIAAGQTAHQCVQPKLYSEMTDEFCFALKCLGSRQRPALRRQCSKCMPKSSSILSGNVENRTGPANSSGRNPNDTGSCGGDAGYRYYYEHNENLHCRRHNTEIPVRSKSSNDLTEPQQQQIPETHSFERIRTLSGSVPADRFPIRNTKYVTTCDHHHLHQQYQQQQQQRLQQQQQKQQQQYEHHQCPQHNPHSHHSALRHQQILHPHQFTLHPVNIASVASNSSAVQCLNHHRHYLHHHQQPQQQSQQPQQSQQQQQQNLNIGPSSSVNANEIDKNATTTNNGAANSNANDSNTVATISRAGLHRISVPISTLTRDGNSTPHHNAYELHYMRQQQTPPNPPIDDIQILATETCFK